MPPARSLQQLIKTFQQRGIVPFLADNFFLFRSAYLSPDAIFVEGMKNIAQRTRQVEPMKPKSLRHSKSSTVGSIARRRRDGPQLHIFPAPRSDLFYEVSGILVVFHQRFAVIGERQ